MGTIHALEPHCILAHIQQVASAYQLASLTRQLETCQHLLAHPQQIEVAIFGRFKAGKSSFLNSVVGMEVVPVGVVPVTSVITKLTFGEQLQVSIHYQDGTRCEVALGEVAEFVSEAHNPANRKGVATVELRLPQLAPYPGIIFVDTPGIGSVLPHNTVTAREWLARVGASLVAVSVDPPFTEQDLHLLRALRQLTPTIVILLTKADLLSPPDLEEVRAFVATQIHAYLGLTLTVLPFSIKTHTAHFRETLDRELFAQLTNATTAHAEQLLLYKLTSLLQQLTDYLEIARKAAETSEQDRHVLRQDLLGAEFEAQRLKEDLVLRRNQLLVKTRPQLLAHLYALQPALHQQLTQEFDAQWPQWQGNLWQVSRQFEEWLYQSLASLLTAVSLSEQRFFSLMGDDAQQAFARLLEAFHLRLAERVERVLGIRLTAPASDLVLAPPRAPALSIGNVFEHHLDLLWFLIPMTLFGGPIKRHFRGKLAGILDKSLARLATRWANSLHSVIARMAYESYTVIRTELSTMTELLRHHHATRPEIETVLGLTREFQEHLGQHAAHSGT